MFHHEFVQTQNVQISRWLLHLQGKVKQVKPQIVAINLGECLTLVFNSSRFTDSDKYAESFLGCFKIDDVQDRNGDICNACVLIVKRWKKLPVNSTKDWSHVVDARLVNLQRNFFR